MPPPGLPPTSALAPARIKVAQLPASAEATPLDAMRMGVRDYLDKNHDLNRGSFLQAVRRQLELITRPDGQLGWYVTNKSLVRSAAGEAVAIAAVSVDEHMPEPSEAMGGLGATMAHIRAHFDEPCTLAELAQVAQMTPAALERRSSQ